MRAGLDVYGEKPFTHSLREGRALCDAVKRYGRVWQTGSWQRSEDNFHRACELVRNGRIGKILRVEVGLPSGYTDFARTFGQEKIESPPPGFDYDRWLGPAPYVAVLHGARPHELALEHGLRRRPAHGLDRTPPRHRPLGASGFERTGPVEVKGTGEFPTTGIYNGAKRYWVETKYADGTPMVLAGGYPEIQSGTKWIGDDRLGLGRPRRLREPARPPRAGGHRAEREAALPQPRPLPELPRLRAQPRGDDRAGRGRRTARRASATSA